MRKLSLELNELAISELRAAQDVAAVVPHPSVTGVGYTMTGMPMSPPMYGAYAGVMSPPHGVMSPPATYLPGGGAGVPLNAKTGVPVVPPIETLQDSIFAPS